VNTARPIMAPIDTTPRRWKAEERPALLPPTDAAASNNFRDWELVAVNSKTATVRNHWIVGELAYPVADVRVMDPLPWLITEGQDAGHRLAVRPAVTPATWEPRTLTALRAAGIPLGVDLGSPLDTGERADPKVWSHLRAHELRHLTGNTLTEERYRFGRVDFDDDASQTVATVHGDRQADGSYIFEVYAHDAESVTVRETAEDAHPAMRAALEAWREAEAAYAAACAEEERTGREKEPAAYYARDDAAVEFANVAAAWIAARLGVSA